jgi:hypothetical protein
MSPRQQEPSNDIVRSEALFLSALQPSDHPGGRRIREAVARALTEFGSQGCAERVAQEFGDHPDIAVARMRWARQQVAEAFGRARLVDAYALDGGW